MTRHDTLAVALVLRDLRPTDYGQLRLWIKACTALARMIRARRVAFDEEQFYKDCGALQ